MRLIRWEWFNLIDESDWMRIWGPVPTETTHRFENPSGGQTVHFWPHSVIHNRKAVHLKPWWEVNFRPPLKRQNFRDASGQICYSYQISCHNHNFWLHLEDLGERWQIWGWQISLNIARGTTDPEIDSETWTKLGNNMAPLALIANLSTRWRHLTFSH